MAPSNWLITGASNGIGSEIAIRLAASASCLILHGRSETDLESMRARCLESGAAAVDVIVKDLSHPYAGEQLAHEAMALCATIDGLVCAAGFSKQAEVADLTEEAASGILKTNALSIQALTRALLPQLTARPGSNILFIASIAGSFPMPNGALYAASKAWLVSFGTALHIELKNKGTHVTTLCPGATKTRFFDRAGIDLNQRWAKHSSWHEPSDVAEIGLRALRKNKMVQVCGLRNKLSLILPRILSRRLLGRLVLKESAPNE